jgi:hypothetical protein
MTSLTIIVTSRPPKQVRWPTPASGLCDAKAAKHLDFEWSDSSSAATACLRPHKLITVLVLQGGCGVGCRPLANTTHSLWAYCDSVDASLRCKTILTSLTDYRSGVSEFYDEILHEVAAQVELTGSLGKIQLGALFMWKRMQRGSWARKLLSLPDSDVRLVTARAVDAVRNESISVAAAAKAGRSALSVLPGMRNGDAFASAVLVAAAPRRMAVYDWRARNGLGRVGLVLTNGRGRYGRYMQLIEQIRQELLVHSGGTNLCAREVDLALYWLAKLEIPASED